MRILVTRPREDAEALAGLLGARGLETIIEPLLEIEYVDGPRLDLDGVQALVATSANGLRAFAKRENNTSLPVFAVGDASARAAKEAGFTWVLSAAGDVQALAALLVAECDPARGALLHAAGSRLAGDLAGLLEGAGFAYRREVLYRSRKSRALSASTAQALKEGAVDGILFFSPRTAETFVILARNADLAESCSGVMAFCLSAAVAAMAEGLAWRQVVIAGRPVEDSLLAAIDAAQRSPGGGNG